MGYRTLMILSVFNLGLLLHDDPGWMIGVAIALLIMGSIADMVGREEKTILDHSREWDGEP